jgi:hypothetical protein
LAKNKNEFAAKKNYIQRQQQSNEKCMQKNSTEKKELK